MDKENHYKPKACTRQDDRCQWQERAKFLDFKLCGAQRRIWATCDHMGGAKEDKAPWSKVLSDHEVFFSRIREKAHTVWKMRQLFNRMFQIRLSKRPKAPKKPTNSAT